MRSLSLATFLALLVFSCSPRYMIHPERDTTFKVDGHEAQVAEAPGCRVNAYSVKNDFADLIVAVQVMNSAGGDLDVSPSQFTLTGPALAGDTQKAVEPAAYFAKLRADAENLRKRTELNSNTWEGVDTLTQTLPTAEGKKDKAIEKVRGELKATREQQKKDLKRADELAVKGKALEPRLVTSGAARNGKDWRGEILFAGPFAKSGKITLNFTHPKCAVALPFTLKK